MSPASRDGTDIPTTRVESLPAAARGVDLPARWPALDACRDYLRLVAHRNRRSKRDDGPNTSDLVQITIAEGRGGFPRFQGRTLGQLLGWLRIIPVHSLFRAPRRRRPEPRPGEDAPSAGLATALTPASTAAQRDESNAVIDSALRRLPEPCRTVVHLRLWEDLSFPEIGARMGLSEEAARTLFARAILRLRELMGSGLESR